MLKCYERKFPKSNVIRPFKAITYFKDINFEESVVMIEGVYHWKNIERRLLDMTKEQSRVFDKLPLK